MEYRIVFINNIVLVHCILYEQTIMSAVAVSRAVSRSARAIAGLPQSLLSNQRNTFSSSSDSSSGIQLKHDWVQTPESHNNDHVVLFLHGLLGNGRNLRTMAKKLCDNHNQPGMLLDVRGHGGSKLDRPQLSTFDACVQDLQHTLDHHIPEVTTDTRVTLVGHSLGGRISLQCAYNSLRSSSSSLTDSRIHRVWLLDTVPGQANESVERVVGAVTELSSQSAITDRKTLVEQLTSSQYGIDKGTAQWLAASLQTNKDSGSMEFGFDLAVVNDLLADFHSQDFMGMLSDVVASGTRVDLVRGGKNTGWSESTLGPLRELEQQSSSHFGMHFLPNAGHWVHVDDLPGLLGLMDVSVSD